MRYHYLHRYFTISGTVLFAGLLIASIGLYALDIYATARIDQLLLDYYGPQIYERYTNFYDPNVRLTATTENDYYGYRSLYGLKVLGWLQEAHLAYGATKEVIQDPTCQKRLICELKSTPKEDKTWFASKLDTFYNSVYSADNQDIFYEIGYRNKCQNIYTGCHDFEKYEDKL